MMEKTMDGQACIFLQSVNVLRNINYAGTKREQ